MKKHLVKTLEEENLTDDSIYTKEERLHLIEDDELSPWEEAFMEGYERAE